MAGQLANKVVLVTGAGAGIGKDSALLFAREGAKVVVNCRTAEAGQETVSMIKQAGGEAMFVRADVSSAADVQAMLDKIVESYGRLDCALNNAGVQPTGRLFNENAEEDWDRIININLKGVWLCMRGEITQMLKQGKGNIVNTSSMLGLVGREKRSIYTASKHGIIGLTKGAALEFANQGIRVNAICAGVIRTPLLARLTAADPQLEENFKNVIAMRRLGTTEEVAEAALWLFSDASSYVTGVAMPVDGGYVVGK